MSLAHCFSLSLYSGTLTQFTLVLYGTASSLPGSSTPDSGETVDSSCKTYDLNQICTGASQSYWRWKCAPYLLLIVHTYLHQVLENISIFFYHTFCTMHTVQSMYRRTCLIEENLQHTTRAHCVEKLNPAMQFLVLIVLNNIITSAWVVTDNLPADWKLYSRAVNLSFYAGVKRFVQLMS